MFFSIDSNTGCIYTADLMTHRLQAKVPTSELSILLNLPLLLQQLPS